MLPLRLCNRTYPRTMPARHLKVTRVTDTPINESGHVGRGEAREPRWAGRRGRPARPFRLPPTVSHGRKGQFRDRDGSFGPCPCLHRKPAGERRQGRKSRGLIGHPPPVVAGPLNYGERRNQSANAMQAAAVCLVVRLGWSNAGSDCSTGCAVTGL